MNKVCYSFGMTMPGRNANPTTYRHGFNGMEKDDELKGNGNSYDFGARIYDSRLGRWLSLDPLMTKYAYLSPYNYSGNSPIALIDIDGKDFTYSISEDGTTITVMMTVYTISRKTYKQAKAAASIWNNTTGTSQGYTIKFDIQVIKPPVITRSEVEAANVDNKRLFKKDGTTKTKKYFEIEGQLQDERMLEEAQKEGRPIGQNNVYAGANNFGAMLSVSRDVPDGEEHALAQSNGTIITSNVVTTGIPSGSNSATSEVYGALKQTFDGGERPQAVAHEFGHNLGFNHPESKGLNQYNGGNGQVNQIELDLLVTDILNYEKKLGGDDRRRSNPGISEERGSASFQNISQQQ